MTLNCLNYLNADEKKVNEKNTIWTPFTGHNMTPWVKIWFLDADFCISVGNDSMPGGKECEGSNSLGDRPQCMGQKTNGKYLKNHAIIKSFTYGCSGGRTNGSDGIKVEILDEEGSEFCNFMINIFPKNRNKKNPAALCQMAFQFGWITTDCNNNTCLILSRKRICYPLQVDVSFIGGMIKFAINACNPGEVLIEGVSNTKKTDLKMRLKPAIREIFKDYYIKPLFLSAVTDKPCGVVSCRKDFTSKCSNVKYKEVTSYKEWKFYKDEGCEGIESGGDTGGWKTNNKDPITASMAWLKDRMTDSKIPRGFIVGGCNVIGTESTQNHTIFWESPLPDCQGRAPNMENIGTFIVNGGECSNVLSFNPQINWQVANVTQGGNTGDVTAQATLAKKECKISGEGTGETLQISPETTSKYKKDAGNIQAIAHAANARAMPPAAAVEAELLIQGNPYLDDPLALCAGVECSIIVINPFMFRPIGNSKDGNKDWIADPPMNAFLSNRHWLIQGVSHEIKEGSFTTTLKVWLASPGVDIDFNAQLGGPPGPTLKKTQ
jgi:hypothetical protein